MNKPSLWALLHLDIFPLDSTSPVREQEDPSSTIAFGSCYLFPLIGAALASMSEEGEVTGFHMAQLQEMPRNIYVDRRNVNSLGRRFRSYGKISRRSQSVLYSHEKKSPKEAAIGEQE